MMPTPVHVFAKWKVKEDKLQAVLKLIRELATETRKEKGNLFYTVNQSRTDTGTLILHEGYDDEGSQKAHVASVHYQRLAVTEIIPMLSEREVFLTSPMEI